MSLGYSTYSLFGWSDSGISTMLFAVEHPSCVSQMVIWGCNAFLMEKDFEMYEAVRDTQMESKNEGTFTG